MNNYNDFPLLSNEQYLELNKLYNLQKPQNPLFQIGSKLQFCIDSFLSIQPNYNSDIQNQISIFVNELNNYKDSLITLYPNLKFNTSKIGSNLFVILSEIVEVISLVNNIIKENEKTYYKKVLSKLNNNVLNNLSMFMLILSKQNIKFFKNM